jgi:threonine dehydrogenase-like Zn-dependent dehydrogenase
MGLAVALVSSDVVDAKSLITHRVPFSKAIDAYEMHRTRSDGIVKIVIEMPGAESGL